MNEETNQEDGRLIPFQLVQHELLPHLLGEIDILEDAMTTNAEAVAEIFDTLTEEEKDKYANDDNTAFVTKKFPKFKKGQEFPEGTIEYKLQQVNALLAEAKNLKKKFAEKHKELMEKTRASILSIDMETATRLMDSKWTYPLCDSIARVPEEVVHELAEKVQHLADKYATTYQDISNRIQSAESRLYTLLGELEADKADALGLAQFRQTLNNAQ